MHDPLRVCLLAESTPVRSNRGSKFERAVSYTVTFSLSSPVTKEGHKFGHDSDVNDHLYLLVAAVGEVRDGPHRVHQDVNVRVVDQHRQRRQNFLESFNEVSLCNFVYCECVLFSIA